MITTFWNDPTVLNGRQGAGCFRLCVKGGGSLPAWLGKLEGSHVLSLYLVDLIA